MGKLKRGFEPAAFGVGHLQFAMICIRTSGPVAWRLEQGTHIERARFWRVAYLFKIGAARGERGLIATQTRSARFA